MANITTNLELYYRLDEGAGTTAYDWSSNGRHGTLINTPTWITTAKIRGGLNFASAFPGEYVTFTEFSRTGAEAWTFACWARFSSLFSDGKTLVVGFSAPANNTIRYSNTNEVVVVRTQTANNLDFDVGLLDSATVWHHTVVVREAAGNIHVYVDTVPSVDNPIADAGAMAFGQLGRRVNHVFMDGDLDDVRVYSRALSAADIAKLLNCRPVSKLYALYEMPGVY